MKSYWYKLGLMGMNKLMKRKGKKRLKQEVIYLVHSQNWPNNYDFSTPDKHMYVLVWEGKNF